MGWYSMFGRVGTFMARVENITGLLVEMPQAVGTFKPLNIAKRTALAGWMFTLKNKCEVVGTLQDFDPSSMAM